MVYQLGDIVRDKGGNTLIITDIDVKELVYTVYSLTAEAAYGRIFAEDLKRDFAQIVTLLDSSKRPLFEVGDKVVWVKKLEKDMEEGESGVIVGPPKFNTELKVWGYSVMFKRELGYFRGFVLETHLVKDEDKKPVKSIEELLIEIGTRINAENPDYICAVEKTEEGLYAGENMSVVFKCLATHPNLCEKRIISLLDAEDGAKSLPNFICTAFSAFKQRCEAQRRMEQAKVDYTQFYKVGARSNGKTELQKMLLNAGIYATKDDSPSKKLAELAPYVTKGLADGINSEPDKDFWSAFGYSMLSRPYTNAVAKYCKNDVDYTNKLFEEESEMNVTKVNKKQEEELKEYYVATPMSYRPKKIIFNGPATIVIWQDNSKTVVKCGGNEEYDRKLAFKYALHKRYAELKKTNYLRQFTKALEKTGDPQAAFIETFAKIEMNNHTVGEGDRYFKAIERHFKKEFES